MRILPTLTYSSTSAGMSAFVLERIDIAFRSRLDEFFVELLSAEFVLRTPLCPCLGVQVR
jgi:hypothetical protein